MEEQKFSFTGSFQKAKEYVDTQLELIKLNAIAKASRIAGFLILDITKLVLLLIIIFFLSLALGFFLGELMNSYALGFLTTAVLFIILLLVVKAMEPQLESKFMNILIARILSRWNDDEDSAINERFRATHEENMKKAEETKVADFYKEEIPSNEEKN